MKILGLLMFIPAIFAQTPLPSPFQGGGGGGGGGSSSVFTGSTGSTVASSATPVFSLSDVSVKSPIVFNISPTVNVTGPTITNLTAGARFVIRITTDGTHTWSWNGIVADGACQPVTESAITTEAQFVVDPNGTTIHGDGCMVDISGLLAYGSAVADPAFNPVSGNMIGGLTTRGATYRDSGGVFHDTVKRGVDMATDTGAVVGLETVPFCTGFTPTNSQFLQYTTASSPNPCYTATAGAGSTGGVLFFGNAENSSVAASSTNYLRGDNSSNATLITAQRPSPAAYTLKGLYVVTNSTQSATGSVTCSVVVNGTTPSVIVFTIAASAAAGTYSDSTHTLAISAGDLVAVQCVNAATAVSAAMTGWSIGHE